MPVTWPLASLCNCTAFTTSISQAAVAPEAETDKAELVFGVGV